MTEPMHIMVVDALAFTPDYTGAFCRGLEAAGLTVSLVGPRGAPAGLRGVSLPLSARHYARANGSVLPERLGWYARHASYSVRLLPVLSAARRLRPDIVHFQWNHIPLVEGPVVRALRRIAPVVHTAHDTTVANGDRASALKRWNHAGLLRSFDLVVTHTQQGRARLVARGVSPERIAVVPHGALSGPPRPQRRDREGGDDRVEFLLFGVLKPYKGIDVLLKAAALLPDAVRRRVRIRVAGEAVVPIEPWLRMIESADLSGFVSIEPGHVAEQDLPDVLGRADVFLFPYLEIEASGVLMMTLPYGRPIIASRIGAFAELLTDGEHGRLVKPGHAQQLAEAIAALAAEPARREAMGASVRAVHGAVPSWHAIGEQMAQLYARILPRGRTAAS